MSERERKTFWVAGNSTVQQAEGLSCAPENPEYWWFPTLGFSACYGVHVFDDREIAVRAAVADLEKKRAEIDRRLQDLGAGGDDGRS